MVDAPQLYDSSPQETTTRPTTSHQFPTLAKELRDRIWLFSLPPPRILHIRPQSAPSDGGYKYKDWTYYTTSPSYGGRYPGILSANRESRSMALRFLTFRFKAWWNLDIDTLYLEAREPAGPYDALYQLCNLRTRNLLDDFKHLALDWESWDVRFYENPYVLVFLHRSIYLRKRGAVLTIVNT